MHPNAKAAYQLLSNFHSTLSHELNFGQTSYASVLERILGTTCIICVSNHSCFKELALNFIDFHPTLLFASQIHSCLAIFPWTRKTSSLILTDGLNYKGKKTLLLRRTVI